MTLSPLLPPGLTCDPAGSAPRSAELRAMMGLALRRGAQSVAVGGGRSPTAAAAVTEFTR